MTFSTLEEADEHVDTGHHVMLPAENECVYDAIRRQWAATATSIKGKSQKIGESQYHSYAAVQEGASHGWALRKQKTTVRISPAVKDYLTRVFNEGTMDGQPKANPADVAEDLKKKFTKPEWLEVQTIKGYFSRLAALQRGQEISEEDTSNEDGAIAREEFLQDLIQETQKQIDLRHPLVCDSINLCELFVANKLDQTLKKLKISTLKSMCFVFGADISGPATRKAIYQCHLWSTEVLPVSNFSIRIERLFIPSRPCKMSYYLLILVLACDTSILGSEQQVKYHLTVLTIVKCCQRIIRYHRFARDGQFFPGVR